MSGYVDRLLARAGAVAPPPVRMASEVGDPFPEQVAPLPTPAETPTAVPVAPPPPTGASVRQPAADRPRLEEPQPRRVVNIESGSQEERAPGRAVLIERRVEKRTTILPAASPPQAPVVRLEAPRETPMARVEPPAMPATTERTPPDGLRGESGDDHRDVLAAADRFMQEILPRHAPLPAPPPEQRTNASIPPQKQADRLVLQPAENHAPPPEAEPVKPSGAYIGQLTVEVVAPQPLPAKPFAPPRPAVRTIVSGRGSAAKRGGVRSAIRFGIGQL